MIDDPVLQAFPPIIDEKSRVLILGSMPSVSSLEKSQYYAHPHNAFWRRDGSADAAIRDVVANDFAIFFQQWPRIERICFNGQAAEKLFEQKVLKKQGLMSLAELRPALQACRLPSTSPAHAVSYVDKLAQWQVVRHWVDEVT